MLKNPSTSLLQNTACFDTVILSNCYLIYLVLYPPILSIKSFLSCSSGVSSTFFSFLLTVRTSLSLVNLQLCISSITFSSRDNPKSGFISQYPDDLSTDYRSRSKFNQIFDSLKISRNSSTLLFNPFVMNLSIYALRVLLFSLSSKFQRTRWMCYFYGAHNSLENGTQVNLISMKANYCEDSVYQKGQPSRRGILVRAKTEYLSIEVSLRIIIKLMEGDKVETLEVKTRENVQQYQRVLANYEFKRGRKLVIQGNAKLAKFIIPMAESVIMRDKYVEYHCVDYEGQKDMFRVELKSRK